MSIEKILPNEKYFPGIINEIELVAIGGKQIQDTTYFQLESEDKNQKAVYEPLPEKDKDVRSYSLRRVLKNN